MNKTVKFIVNILLLLTISGCNKAETAEKIPRGIPPLKTVEIFEIGQNQPKLVLSKTGTVESSIIANISPQISGKITSLDVKIGQKVKKGQTLITLGDSLQIDLANLQHQTSTKSLKLTETSQILTKELGEGNYLTAQINIKNAAEAYKKAIESKETAENLFENQQESTELAIDTAEKALETAKKNYNNLSDLLDELEDQYSELESQSDTDPKTLSGLKSSIDQLKSQLVNAKFAKESAGNTLEQTKLGLDQTEESFSLQQDELDFAMENAYLAYQIAVVQARNLTKTNKLQELSTAEQTLQTNSGLTSTALTLDQTKLKSPIEGIVTKINSKENTFINPGEPVITVENLNSISIKTSLNQEELSLLTTQTEIFIETSGSNIPAKIINISPTLDIQSKKTEIEITPSKDNTRLLPGSLVKINFKIIAPDKIFIPLNSITLNEDKKLVRVLDQKNKVHITEITLGQIIGNFVEITQGLKGYETIIKSTYPEVEEGERIIPND